MLTIILAAGRHGGVRSFSFSYPAPLLPVADRPAVAHTADAAIEAGADELVFVVRSEDWFRPYFGDEYAGVPVHYEIQSEETGTADAVRVAHHRIDGPFVVLNGDNLYDSASLSAVMANEPAVGAYPVADPSDYGVLRTDCGRVVEVIEKARSPPTTLVNTGAYAFPTKARDWLTVPRSDRGDHELTDVLGRVAATFDVTAVEHERWLDVSRPWNLLEANEWRLADLDPDVSGTVHPTAELRGAVVVEAGADVDAGAVVEGPTLLRPGATVAPGAYIRGSTLVCESASVGHGVELENSVLMRDARVAHRSRLAHSVLAPESAVGAGTTVANRRLDGEPVAVAMCGKRIPTGREEFGVVVGEGAETAIDTSLGAGLMLPPGSRTRPDETIVRDR